MMFSPMMLLQYAYDAVIILIALAALFGAFQIATTREDAFDVAGRKPKWLWFAFMVGSALAVVLKLFILSWVAYVVIGVYFFDVRPQIKDILSGNNRW